MGNGNAFEIGEYALDVVSFAFKIIPSSMVKSVFKEDQFGAKKELRVSLQILKL